MIGLALEGGGARGAYHIGVVKAYLEDGYEFDGFVGTSIGSVNAAILAQGDFEKAVKMWSTLSMENIFDTDEKNLLEIGKMKFTADLFSNLRISLKNILDSGGIDTSKMKAIISANLDEEKVRNSGKDFGLVTVSINERKPYELFLDDIPKGKLINYIMASSSFPGFKSEIIDDKAFIDGGIYNNCPINMLLKLGYEDIIAVRTMAIGHYLKVEENNSNITIIEPYSNLGEMMIFSPNQIKANMKLGYYDGMRALKNLKGRKYYIKPDFDYKEILLRLSDETIRETGELLNIKDIPPKRMLFENIIPRIGNYLKLKKNFDYDDFVIALLEYEAEKNEVRHFKIYSFNDFLYIIQKLNYFNSRLNKKPSNISTTIIDKTIYKRTTAIETLTTEILNFNL